MIIHNAIIDDFYNEDWFNEELLYLSDDDDLIDYFQLRSIIRKTRAVQTWWDTFY